jgi:hypothetical protein
MDIKTNQKKVIKVRNTELTASPKKRIINTE